MTRLFSLCTFLSALLLFSVQPLIAKAILPWYGGSAGVWNCCQFFFQAVLLLGYTYAHFSVTRTHAARQRNLHWAAMAASLAFLPILPSLAWKPTAGQDPSLQVLLTLIASVGLPYFVLSSTSPLLGSWYSRLHPERNPYPLFAWSNFGSFLGLLGYPLWLEPQLGVHAQGLCWSALYLVCLALLAYLAQSQKSAPLLKTEQKTTRIDPLWIGLPMCSTVLLVAATHHISSEVAAVPLLWVIPLALYLASYVLVASSWKLYHRKVFFPLFLLALVGFQNLLEPNYSLISARTTVLGLWACLAIVFTVCHGELWRHRPPPAFLSHFFLAMSLGGAAGSFFVAYCAPVLFSDNYELPLCLLLCPIVILYSSGKQRTLVYALAIPALVFYAIHLGEHVAKRLFDQLVGVRNFYGTTRVCMVLRPRPWRLLCNGSTNHGAQFLEQEDRPTGYYGENSGIGRVIRELQRRHDTIRVGVVGLGAGTLATYGRPGDDYTFYELDPKIEKLADETFTFLKHCQAQHRVILGDARLSLEQATPGFDLLVIDAFSGDSIPVHLLTQEAFAMYLPLLKPEGVLALHVSNRYLNLPMVVAAQAQAAGQTAILFNNIVPPEEQGEWTSTWSVVTRPDNPLVTALGSQGFLQFADVPKKFVWTDDLSNLLPLLK